MLWGCVSAYQDADCLRETLPVLVKIVDRIVLVDGAYKGFKRFDAGTWSSTDATRELARDHGAMLVEASPELDEREKRSRYFVGQPGDWYLVVDADEVVHGSLDREFLAASDPDDYWIEFYDEDSPWQVDRGRRVFRLHRHRPGMRYHRAHHALHVPDASCDGGLAMVLDERLPTIPGLRIAHAKDRLRPRWREDPKQAYFELLKAEERDFRAARAL